MNFFKKKEEIKEEAEPCNDLSKAKSISDKYSQISSCCKVLAEIESEETDFIDAYCHGWKLSGFGIKASVIDINEIYDYIKTLAIKRKKELEAELTQL